MRDQASTASATLSLTIKKTFIVASAPREVEVSPCFFSCMARFSSSHPEFFLSKKLWRQDSSDEETNASHSSESGDEFGCSSNQLESSIGQASDMVSSFFGTPDESTASISGEVESTRDFGTQANAVSEERRVSICGTPSVCGETESQISFFMPAPLALVFVEPTSPAYSCASPTWAAYPDSIGTNQKQQLIVPLPDGDPTLTTLVAKNFPESYTRHDLISFLNAYGFNRKFDFIYFPLDFTTMKSFGYAFINFVTNRDALLFGKFYNGFAFSQDQNTDVGVAEWSTSLQGLQKHVESYRNSPMMHPMLPECVKPALFLQGRQVAFPQPTKPLKRPRGTNRKSAAPSAVEPAPSQRLGRDNGRNVCFKVTPSPHLQPR